jgi:hypothetical protein
LFAAAISEFNCRKGMFSRSVRVAGCECGYHEGISDPRLFAVSLDVNAVIAKSKVE